METYLKDAAIHRINQLGADNTPFVFVIDYAMNNCVVLPIDEIAPGEILFNIKGFCNYALETNFTEPLQMELFPEPFDSYRLKFEKAHHALMDGDSYLLNLTAPTPIRTNYSIREIFHASRAPYRLLLPDRFVVFSPETFVEINAGIITTRPMKGTIDATLPQALESIMGNEKEKAEQYTIVDLLRNDLNIVAKEVTVNRFRYSTEIESRGKRLLQISSEISGKLPKDYPAQIGSILFALLPAGSITGAPKKRTVALIAEIENYNRGYYTGVFGYFANGKLDCGVMIRFIEQTSTGLVFKSGGGITTMSDAEKEYQELLDKVYVPIT